MDDVITPWTSPDVIHSTVDGVDTPPDPAEWRICWIDTNHRQVTAGDARYACQTCGDGVLVREAHVAATLREQVDVGPRHRHLVFCNRGCWRYWASQESEK